MEIKSLYNISFDAIFQAFEEAFRDYEMQLTKDELAVMLQRRGFVPELSYGAFDNGKPVSFTFNGIGQYDGNKTAYDTGTGTIEAYRGQGLPKQIFEYAIPFLKKAGIKNYLLEVLQHNSKALTIYKKLGFQTVREFNYFKQQKEKVKRMDRQLNSIYNIKPTDLSEYKTMQRFFDFHPSWQNSFEAIRRKPDDFNMLGAYKENELIGYCICEPKSGDITQIAVNKTHRRRGIGSVLLLETLKTSQHPSIKIINTEVECNSITHFLTAHNIPLAGKQFEMIKKL